MILPSNIAGVYLHGFLSSPKSKKAQQLIQYFDDNQMAEQLSVPTLSFEPAVAIQQAQDAIQELKQQPGIDQVFLMGSSLGGFYATYLAEHESLKAVLINPAVRPFELFDKYLGPNKHFYDGNTYMLELKHIEQLQGIEVECLSEPKESLLLLQTGDETLDYRLATEKYIDCPSWIEPGGNHSFEGFIERLELIFHFVTR
jgi:predicted esterase YcpF (UPF0227 family)